MPCYIFRNLYIISEGTTSYTEKFAALTNFERPVSNQVETIIKTAQEIERFYERRKRSQYYGLVLFKRGDYYFRKLNSNKIFCYPRLKSEFNYIYSTF